MGTVRKLKIYGARKELEGGAGKVEPDHYHQQVLLYSERCTGHRNLKSVKEAALTNLLEEKYSKVSPLADRDWVACVQRRVFRMMRPHLDTDQKRTLILSRDNVE